MDKKKERNDNRPCPECVGCFIRDLYQNARSENIELKKENTQLKLGYNKLLKINEHLKLEVQKLEHERLKGKQNYCRPGVLAPEDDTPDIVNLTP